MPEISCIASSNAVTTTTPPIPVIARLLSTVHSLSNVSEPVQPYASTQLGGATGNSRKCAPSAGTGRAVG
jgi:hypothetical protein